MRFEKIWVEQYRATKGIKRRFGVKSALDYLIGEKLIAFAEAAERNPAWHRGSFRNSLRLSGRCLTKYEVAGYVASQKPAARRQLRKLLFLK